MKTLLASAAVAMLLVFAAVASAGYVANVQQSAATLAGMRATVALVPLMFLALSCVAMLLNPLGRERRRLGGEVKGPVDAVALR